MLELIAQGTDADSRWRRQLPEKPVELGRTTPAYRVPWDGRISRCHVRLIPQGKDVLVEKVPEASNPVFFNGQEETSFLLKPGEHFVIGETTFTLAADRAFVSLDVPNPISQKTFSPEFLRQVNYRDADRRIDVLNRIPEAISSAGNVEDLLIRMINTLIAGIASASTVGIVRLGETDLKHASVATDESNDQSQDVIEVIQWDRRGLDSGDFQPSASLIRQAIDSQESILHIWNQGTGNQAQYTYDYANDWAFACPITSAASQGWGIYVAGTNRGGGSPLDSGSGQSDLQGDIKFCELVGSTLKNLLLVKQLERQQSSLRAFFSPIVMEAFVGRDPDEVLAPRKCDVSVLFCDLRGFSKTSEQMADNLLELLARVSDSLGVMTRKILAHSGVIGDFHGDSAMGFWGWPLDPNQISDNAVAAVTAALEIHEEVQENLRSNSGLQSFQIGLGIASGQAVAGKIGTEDQVKVTVFGPVVNLASRLEGMTRWLNSDILIDKKTAQLVETGFTPHDKPVTRRLGTFQPFGMASSLDAYQVFAPGSLPEFNIACYADALAHFQSGQWDQSLETLKELPANDSAGKFLSDFIRQRSGRPPENWNGVIQMQAK